MKKKKFLHRICFILLHRLSWEDQNYREVGDSNPWPPVHRMKVLWDAEEVSRQILAQKAGHTYVPLVFPARLYRLLKKGRTNIRLELAMHGGQTGDVTMHVLGAIDRTVGTIERGFDIRTWYGPEGEVYLAGVKGSMEEFWR